MGVREREREKDRAESEDLLFNLINLISFLNNFFLIFLFS